jgi:hypothetical protein
MTTNKEEARGIVVEWIVGPRIDDNDRLVDAIAAALDEKDKEKGAAVIPPAERERERTAGDDPYADGLEAAARYVTAYAEEVLGKNSAGAQRPLHEHQGVYLIPWRIVRGIRALAGEEPEPGGQEFTLHSSSDVPAARSWHTGRCSDCPDVGTKIVVRAAGAP